MSTDSVETLRRFNRTWSQRVGVLEDSFLGSGRPLAPARLLFEIGHHGESVLRLRTRLGFDSGHLSRLLRQLEGEGLVEVVPDPEDARRRIAHLTAAGKMAWQDLDDRSDVRARQLVDPLTERQRLRLTEALETAERITRAATVDLQIVDPLSDGARVAVGAFFDEIDRRFAAGYDPGTDSAAPMDAMAAPHGVFLVASGDGEPVACGGVQRIDDTTGEIKRMWVHPDWRGLGLGGRMLRRLEQETVRLGYERARLETNGTLTEAIEMYAAAGYGVVERYTESPYADRWFEKRLAPA